MIPTQGSSQQPMSIDAFQKTMINVVYNVCSIVTTPVEMVLRPQYGSRYFPPVIMVFTAIMMIVLPVFSALAEGFSRMLPFARFHGPIGFFGIGTLAKLYFLGSFVHGLRIWRRMIQMEREAISTSEGPALPIFRILPGGFWVVRIIWEPVFVFTLSLVLPNFFILQSSAAHYLMLAALALTMKQYVAWYMQWEFLRELLDARNAGPIIAKIVDNTATEDELATIHLASIPKDIPDDLRRDTASHIARAFSPRPPNEFAERRTQ
jgi:hypothetical protein